MNDIIIANTNSIMSQHKNEHKDYEYYKNMIVDGESGGQCNVSIYKIPPGKAAFHITIIRKMKKYFI